MKSLILEVTSMREFTTSVGYVLYAFLLINGNKVRNIDMSKVSITLKYHQFEVVTSEILEFKGHKYEKIVFFRW